MLFNSWIFALFLPIVLGLYYILRQRWQNRMLLVASYIFYGWWDWRFLSLLGFTTVFDYFCGRAIAASKTPRQRKIILTFSCISNLGILSLFKYFDFFSDSTQRLFDTLGMHLDMPTLGIILPVGISFYTFQSMSYVIDVYRGDLPAARSLIDFALYVSFFPQLVAGPIERGTNLLPQICRQRYVNWNNITSGFLLVLVGLFRKIAIADSVAALVNSTFSHPEACGGLELLLGLYMFSIQIYCDFAGYSDIARGASRMFGIELMLNFEQPYLSTNITEFWRRWHISFSTWLRDYLYIPLGGNRKGQLAAYRNLLIVMLLGGLWHGAHWTFVVWGGLHGTYLAMHKWMLRGRKIELAEGWHYLNRWPTNLLKTLVTFHLVALTWIFFRAADFTHAWTYLTGMFTLTPWPQMQSIKVFAAILAMLLFIDIPQYLTRDHTIMLRWPWPVRGVVYAMLILAIFGLRSDGEIPFIYFQF